MPIRKSPSTNINTMQPKKFDPRKKTMRDIVKIIEHAIDDGRPQTAMKIAELTIKAHPNNDVPYSLFSASLRAAGDLKSAKHFTEAALKKHPVSIPLKLEYLKTLYELRDSKNHKRYALELHRLIMKKGNNFEKYNSLISELNHLAATSLTLPGYTNKELTELHTAPNQPKQCYANQTTLPEGGEIRVAIYSNQIFYHAVGYFIQEILKFHHKKNWKICVFYDNTRAQAVRTKHSDELNRIGVKFEIINLLDQPNQARDAVIAFKPHVTIDIAGRFDGSYYSLAKQRLAPLQISWIGYPRHPGYPEVDFFLSDRYCSPTVNKKDNKCRIYKFDRFFSAYAPSDEILSTPCQRTTRDTITFGSFNNIRKIHDGVIKVWANILKQAGKSTILFKSKSISEDQHQWLLAKFQAEGIAANRIIVANNHDQNKNHYAYFHEVDIALDSWPYNGTTTTCETLCMGVPLIALLGDTHVSRVSAAILHNIGCDELIAQTESEYIYKCVQLSKDNVRLNNYRTKLRKMFLSSEVCNSAQMADALDTFLRNYLAEQT